MAMETFTFGKAPEEPVARVSSFSRPGGAREAHLCVMPGAGGDFAVQLEGVERAYLEALDRAGLSRGSPMSFL